MAMEVDYEDEGGETSEPPENLAGQDEEGWQVHALREETVKAVDIAM